MIPTTAYLLYFVFHAQGVQARWLINEITIEITPCHYMILLLLTLLPELIIYFFHHLPNPKHELSTDFNPTNMLMLELYKLWFVFECASTEASSRA